MYTHTYVHMNICMYLYICMYTYNIYMYNICRPALAVLRLRDHLCIELVGVPGFG